MFGVEDGSRMDPRLEVQEASLDEELNRRDGEPEPRGLHHGLHPGIDEKVLEELLRRVDAVGALLLHHEGYERVALALAERVVDRARDDPPSLARRVGAERVLDARGDGVCRL